MTKLPDKKIVIVGGGAAGLTIAARLRKAAPRFEIIVVEPSEKHYYQPLWTLVGAGEFDKSVSERNEGDLIPAGVRWVKDRVSEFNPEARRVVLGSGTSIAYDALVVAPGIQIHWHKIAGLREALGRNGVCSNYAYEYVDRTWDFIRTFSGGTAVFTHPSTPIKCGGAPQKIMYLADDAFRRSGVREKSRVLFMSGAASLFAVKKYAEALQQVVDRKGLETKYQTNLVEVRGDAREAVFEDAKTGEKSTIKYDLLHVSPPMGAPEFVAKSPLAATTGGWVDVDKFTLQHVRFPEVFSAGDASSAPTSKTAAGVRKQAPVLVANLLSYLRGEPPMARYDGYTSCPLTTGYGKLILAEFDYELTPQETFPFDQSRERKSMYLLKKHVLPKLYWDGMLKGRA